MAILSASCVARLSLEPGMRVIVQGEAREQHSGKRVHRAAARRGSNDFLAQMCRPAIGLGKNRKDTFQNQQGSLQKCLNACPPTRISVRDIRSSDQTVSLLALSVDFWFVLCVCLFVCVCLFI